MRMRARVQFSETLKKEKYDYSDPSKSLMDLMRNLYETGDDEMKRSIAKVERGSHFGALIDWGGGVCGVVQAWTESHEQKARNPLGDGW